VTSGDLSSISAGPQVRVSRRRSAVTLALVAAVCLAVSVISVVARHGQANRKPTAAELSAAATAAVAGRWRSWQAGRIFPATLSYSTSLLTTETASRLGISAQTGCAGAIEPSLAALAGHDRCEAGLRATYLDQLQGIVYTVGVLAFPSARLAATFSARLPSGAGAAIPLRALALPGTAGARFTDGARQAATAQHAGPFVVLTTAGYADGEPAGAGQQARSSDFAPAGQLAAEVIGPLTRPVTVDCNSRAWSC
jgi:hypothetical protein